MASGPRVLVITAEPDQVESYAAGLRRVQQCLQRNAGNISAAAKAARVDRKTFHRLANKHRLRG